jgi:hypothetical protein
MRFHINHMLLDVLVALLAKYYRLEMCWPLTHQDLVGSGSVFGMRIRIQKHGSRPKFAKRLFTFV